MISFLKKNNRESVAGFTLLELLISISIFAFMTAFLVSKYGTFNQGVLLTNLAYDTALTIRSAQSYGLNVQGQATSSTAVGFNYAYGVHFDPALTNQFILFVDLCGDGLYRDVLQQPTCANSATHLNEALSTYTFRTGFTLNTPCAGASAATCTSIPPGFALDILFKRPNPDAVIVNTQSPSTALSYAKITMKAVDGSTKSIVVQSTGQIAVTN